MGKWFEQLLPKKREKPWEKAQHHYYQGNANQNCYTPIRMANVKDKTHQRLARRWSNQNSHTVGQNIKWLKSALEKGLAVSYKIKYTPTLWFSNFTPKYIFVRKGSMFTTGLGQEGS